MNAPTSFDTLAFAKRMKASGMEPRLAEELAEALNETANGVWATKSDIRDVEAKLRELELRLKHDLTLRFGAMAAGIVAVLGVLITLN